MAEARFLLDTNICIYFLAQANPRLERRLARCGRGEIVTSTIVQAEVLIGVQRHGGAAQARAFFEQVAPQPFDAAAALAYATLPVARGSVDRLIAAHALSLGLTLVTNNEGDFEGVPDLAVENWTR